MDSSSNTMSRILIVDDMPQNIQLIGTILREKGFLVSLAQNGRQAIATMEQKIPDLILLDIMMPEMNGYETCRRLKDNPETSDVPVIFMSALSEPVDKVEGFEAGAVDYVTKPIEPEELLARINTHLTIRNLQKDLTKAKETAEKANALKSDFLARMSHEIRTPMNAVTGICHLLSQTELDDKQHDYLKKIQFASNVLLGVINDILDFSRIEAGMMEVERVDFNLYEVLENLSSMLSVRLGDKAIEFLMDVPNDTPCDLIGDPLRLEQILINLAGNAIKFTEQGEIVIRVDTEFVEGDRVGLRFAVRDTGIGIPEDKIGGLFSAFSQVARYVTRKYGGSGLGLAICKHLIKLMGGDIFVTSEPGKGSTFVFTAVFGKQPESQKTNLPTEGLEVNRVLVVDDNLTLCEIMTGIIERFSIEVVSVGSGEEAVDLIEQSIGTPEAAFDIIFMDWKMTGMDGIEASRKIKSIEGLTTQPKIIMLTAFGKEAVRNKASEAGINAFLTKPVTSSMLLKTIMEVKGHKVARQTFDVKQKPELNRAFEKIKGAKVLVVEDNEVNQMLARKLLENAEMRVTVADNGEDGLVKIKENTFDVILMDIQMPVMDGYEATRKIRFEGHETPVIAMTAHAMTGEREKCLSTGMNDYISKPVNPEQLYLVLAKWTPLPIPFKPS